MPSVFKLFPAFNHVRLSKASPVQGTFLALPCDLRCATEQHTKRKHQNYLRADTSLWTAVAGDNMFFNAC